MSAIEQVARLADRLFDLARHRQAHAIREAVAVDGELDSLRSQRYAVLVTFRRDGTPVPSPVWCAVDAAGRAFVKTAADVGKVKRVRNDSRVLIAASTARGKPTGPVIRARARILGPEEWSHAEQTLAVAYGAGRRASEMLLGASGPAAYLEIVARSR